MKDPHRFFSQKQKKEIFDRANGLCEQCQNPLIDGWHAHHKIRHNDFGLTRIENGMALCLRCHQTIEGVYSMTNKIRFRSFQSEFIQKAIDNKKLLWCNYNKKDGLEYLDYDVKSSYRDGVSQGFLKHFDFAAIGGEVIKEHFDFFTPDEAIPLKDYEGSISAIVSKPEIYKPVVDKTISMLRQAQASWSNYKALIAALDQKHAEILYNYVESNYQDVKVIMAISDQGQSAKDNLETFKSGNRDLLISVEMAYIGFDCPEITVIGYLTSKRFQGFLEQLSGRGLRVIMSQLDNSSIPSFENQCLYGVMPADKKMIRFAEQLRTDAQEGFKERKKGPANGGPHDPLSWIKQVNTNGFEGKGYWADGDIDQEELEILNDLIEQEKVNIPLTFMASAIRRAGGNVRNLFTGHKKQTEPSKAKTYTDGDLAKDRRRQIQEREIRAARQYRKRFRMGESKNDITQSIKNVTSYVNKKYRLSTISEASTELLATILDYVSKQLIQDVNNGKVRAPYN